MDILGTMSEPPEERPAPDEERRGREGKEAILPKRPVGRIKRTHSTDKKNVRFESLNFNTVESVNQAWWQLIWKQYRLYTIGVIVISIALVFFVAQYQFLFLLVFMLIVGYATYLYSQANRWFMRKFAEANGWEYQYTAPIESVEGKLFSLGHSQKIYDVVKGELNEHPTRLFRFQYTVGTGKNSSRFRFTVFEIEFEKTEFPHILLRSKKMPRYSSPGSDERKIPLEEEFEGSFELYSSTKYEVEVFQIFTHEFLRFLQRTSAEFSIEFGGRSLYLYDNKAISNKEGLHEIIDVAGKIFKVSAPILNRLHDDFAAMHEYYRK